MNNKNVNTLHGTTSVRDLEGWSLAPEGAAVHSAERVAVIADVHLGYEWARGVGGDSIPAHSLVETLSRLTTLLDRASIDRLVVAGDLVESPAPCARTAGDVRTLIDWLADRGVSLVWLMGDHDPRRASSLPLSCEVAGWTISHGNRPISGRRLIFGHHHPVLRAGGLTAPCFLVGPKTIALPAFSPNAAGLNILSSQLPVPLRETPLRCVAGMGKELLDFGPVASLRDRLKVI